MSKIINPFVNDKAIGDGEKYFYVGGVPPNEFQNCIEWAFGKLTGQEDFSTLIPIWNGKHGDIFEITNEPIGMILMSIGRAYMEENFYKKSRDKEQKERDDYKSPYKEDEDKERKETQEG